MATASLGTVTEYGIGGNAWINKVTDQSTNDNDNNRYYLGTSNSNNYRARFTLTVPSSINSKATVTKLVVKIRADQAATPKYMRGFLTSTNHADSNYENVTDSGKSDEISYLWLDESKNSRATAYQSSGGVDCYLVFDKGGYTPGKTYYVHILPYDSDSAANGSPSFSSTWWRGRNQSGYYSATCTYLGPYTVTYDANGGSGAPSAGTKIHGTALTLSPNKPTRTGYTFKGWATSSTATTANYQPSGSYTNNADITLYAVWEKNKYTLYIYPDGGTWNGKTGNEITEEITYQGTKSIPIPTKTGYTFAGWAWTAHGTMNNSFANSVLSSESHGINVYNNKNNGSVTHTYVPDASDKDKYSNDYIKITKTSTAAEPGLGGFSRTRTAELNTTYYHTFYAKLPTGYYFSRHQNTMPTGTVFEWLTDTKGTGAWKLYSYKITMGSSGTTGQTFGYIAANADSGSSTATVTWYLGANQITKSPTTAQTFTAGAGNTWMFALWVPNKYTVTYDSNGGTGSITADPVYYGSSYTTKANSFEKTGYSFNGWNTKLDGTGTSYSAGSSISNISANITLYAQWTAVKYSISYELDGGTVSGNPTSYTIETATFTLKNPTKTNYTFNGWTGANGTTPQTNVSIIKGSTGNKSYTANWTLNTADYTVKHWQQKVNATSTANNSTNYTEVTADIQKLSGIIGSSITPEVKTYTGFTSPQKQSATIKADGSTTVNYYYTRNSYTLTVKAGTGISNVTGGGSKKYEASVTINATVSTGYTWSKWTIGNNTITTKNYTFNMPANNVTYTASATPITYTVAFNKNGGSSGSMSSQTFTYDVAQNLNENKFYRNGYSFVGWATSSTGSVVYTDKQSVKNLRSSTGTITLYAVWKQKFTISYNTNGGTGDSISNETVNQGDNYDISNTILTKTVQEDGATAIFYHNDGTENSTTITAKDTVTYNLSSWVDGKGNKYNPGATIANVTSNITLTAEYNDKKSTIQGNVTAPANLSREGYTLSGYSIDPGIYTIKYTPNESFQLRFDENLYAVWSPNVYNMTINPNGGQIFNCEAYTSEIINTKFSYNTKTYVGTAIRDKTYGPQISSSTISKELGTATSQNGFSIVIEYALDINTITSENDTITLYNPTTSSKLTSLANCQTALDGGKYVLIEGTVYYLESKNDISQSGGGGWYQNYTIKCNVHPISIVETGTIVSSYSENNSAIKEGYVFEGYEATAGNVALHTNADFFYFEGENHISNSGRGLVSNGTYVFDGNATNDVTITAKFRKKKYTIQYELNNSKITNQTSFSREYDYGDTFTFPSFNSTPIYKFLGWNTAADGSGTTYLADASASNLTSEDGAIITLYAQWKFKNLVKLHTGGASFENAQVYIWERDETGKPKWILATAYVYVNDNDRWKMSTGN